MALFSDCGGNNEPPEHPVTKQKLQIMLENIRLIRDEATRDRLRGKVAGLAWQRSENSSIALEAIKQRGRAHAQMVDACERLQNEISEARWGRRDDRRDPSAAHDGGKRESQKCEGMYGGGSLFEPRLEPVTPSFYAPRGGSGAGGVSGSFFHGPRREETRGSSFGTWGENDPAPGSLFAPKNSAPSGSLFEPRSSHTPGSLLFGAQKSGTNGGLYGPPGSGTGGSSFGTKSSRHMPGSSFGTPYTSTYRPRDPDSFGSLFSDAASKKRLSRHNTRSQSQSATKNKGKLFKTGPHIQSYISEASRKAAAAKQDTSSADASRPLSQQQSLSKATQQAIQLQGALIHRGTEAMGGLKGIRKWAPELVRPAAIIDDTESEACETRKDWNTGDSEIIRSSGSMFASSDPPRRQSSSTPQQPTAPAPPPPSRAANQSQKQSALNHLARQKPPSEEGVGLNEARSAHNSASHRYQLRKYGKRPNQVGLPPRIRHTPAAVLDERRRARAAPASQVFEMMSCDGPSQSQSQLGRRSQTQAAQRRMQILRARRPSRRSPKERAAMKEVARERSEPKQRQQLWSDGPTKVPSASFGRGEFDG